MSVVEVRVVALVVGVIIWLVTVDSIVRNAKSRVYFPLVFFAKGEKYQWSFLNYSVYNECRKHNNEDGAKSKHEVTLVSRHVL